MSDTIGLHLRRSGSSTDSEARDADADVDTDSPLLDPVLPLVGENLGEDLDLDSEIVRLQERNNRLREQQVHLIDDAVDRLEGTGQRIQVALARRQEVQNADPPQAHLFAPVAAPLEVPEIPQLDRPVSPAEHLALFHSGLVTGVMRGVIDPLEVLGHHHVATELRSGRVSPEQTIHHYQLLEGAVSGRVSPNLVVANFQADAGIVMGGGQGPPELLGGGQGPPDLRDGGRGPPELPNMGRRDLPVTTIPTVQSIIENEERATAERFGRWALVSIALPIVMLYNAVVLQKWHFLPVTIYFAVLFSSGLFQLLTHAGFMSMYYLLSVVKMWMVGTAFLSLLDTDRPPQAKLMSWADVSTQYIWGFPIKMLHYNDFIQFSFPVGLPYVCVIFVHWVYFGYLLKVPHTQMWKQGLVCAMFKIGILTYVSVLSPDPRVVAGMIQCGLASALSWYVIEYVLHGKLCATRDEQLRRKIYCQTGCALDVSECALGKNPLSKTWINRPCFIFWKTATERRASGQEEDDEYPPCVHTALSSVLGNGELAKEHFVLIDKIQRNKVDRLKYASILHVASSVLLGCMGYATCLPPASLSFLIQSFMVWQHGKKRYPSLSEEAMNVYRAKYRESCESSHAAFREADCAAQFLRDNADISGKLLQLERKAVKRLNETCMHLFLLGMLLWIHGSPHSGMACVCIFGFALSGQFNYTMWASLFLGLSHTIIMCYLLHSEWYSSMIVAAAFLMETVSIFVSHGRSMNEILGSSSHSAPSYQILNFTTKQFLVSIGVLVSFGIVAKKTSKEWDIEQSNDIMIAYTMMTVLAVCIFVGFGLVGHWARDRTDGVPQRVLQQLESSSQLSASELDMSSLLRLRTLHNDVLKIIRQERWKGVKRFRKASWFLILIPLAILYSQDLMTEQLSMWTYLLPVTYCTICFTGAMKLVTLSGYIQIHGMTVFVVSLVFWYSWSEIVRNPQTSHYVLSLSGTPYRPPFVNYEILMFRVQGVRSFAFPVGAPHILDTVMRFYLFGYLIRLPTLHFCAAECGLCFIKLCIGYEMFDATEHLVIRNGIKQTSLLGAMTMATVIGLYCAMAKSDNARIVKKVRAKTGQYVDASDIDHMLPNNWIKWRRIPCSQFVRQWLEIYRARRLRNSLHMREGVKRCIRRKQQKVIDDFWIFSVLILVCLPQMYIFVLGSPSSHSNYALALLLSVLMLLSISGAFQVLTFSGYCNVFWYHTVVKCAGFSIGMMIPAAFAKDVSGAFACFAEHAFMDCVLHIGIFGVCLHIPIRHFQIHGAFFTVYKWIAVIVLLQDERVYTVSLITFSVLTTIADIMILLCYTALSKKRDETLSDKIKRRLRLPLPIKASISDVMSARWVSWDYVNTLWGRIRAWWNNRNGSGHVHSD